MYSFDSSGIFLMTLWAAIWLFFFVVGRHAKRRLPLHQRLVRYSSAVFVCITLFYWAAFSGVGNLTAYAASGPLGIFIFSGYARIAGILLAVAGAALMMLSRYQLRELTLEELFFSKEESYTHTGLYRYFNHPMYLGISLVLAGSLILYPNMFSLAFMALTLFFLKRKKEVEERRF